MHDSIKGEVSESSKGEKKEGKKTGGRRSPERSVHRIEKVLCWTAGKDHKGPRIKSEEPILRSGSLAGLLTFRPGPFSTGTFLKSKLDHRPVTKPKLFKPTLYKSYCEGSLPREPQKCHWAAQESCPYKDNYQIFNIFMGEDFFFFFNRRKGRRI